MTMTAKPFPIKFLQYTFRKTLFKRTLLTPSYLGRPGHLCFNLVSIRKREGMKETFLLRWNRLFSRFSDDLLYIQLKETRGAGRLDDNGCV